MLPATDSCAGRCFSISHKARSQPALSAGGGARATEEAKLSFERLPPVFGRESGLLCDADLYDATSLGAIEQKAARTHLSSVGHAIKRPKHIAALGIAYHKVSSPYAIRPRAARSMFEIDQDTLQPGLSFVVTGRERLAITFAGDHGGSEVAIGNVTPALADGF